LAVWVLEKPDTWRIDAAAMSRQFKEGRHALLAALKELEEVGYLRRHRAQGPDGKWTSWSTLYESPEQAEQYEPTTEVGFPDVGSPNSGQPTSGEPTSDDPTSIPLVETKSLRGKPLPSAKGASSTAKSVLDPFWEQADPKPVAGYPALLQRIDECLSAGHESEAIARVLPTMSAFSRNAFDLALRKPVIAASRQSEACRDVEAEWRRLGEKHADRGRSWIEDLLNEKGVDAVERVWALDGWEAAQ
jgi:hypothetical protein